MCHCQPQGRKGSYRSVQSIQPTTNSSPSLPHNPPQTIGMELELQSIIELFSHHFLPHLNLTYLWKTNIDLSSKINIVFLRILDLDQVEDVESK